MKACAARFERIFAMSGSGRGKADAADRLVGLDGAEEAEDDQNARRIRNGSNHVLLHVPYNDSDFASLAWRLANDRQLAGLGSMAVLHQLGHPEKRKRPEQFDTHKVYHRKPQVKKAAQ